MALEQLYDEGADPSFICEFRETHDVLQNPSMMAAMITTLNRNMSNQQILLETITIAVDRISDNMERQNVSLSSLNPPAPSAGNVP